MFPSAASFALLCLNFTHAQYILLLSLFYTYNFHDGCKYERREPRFDRFFFKFGILILDSTILLMLVPNINPFYSTVFEKLNNKFSWPLMGSILIYRIT